MEQVAALKINEAVSMRGFPQLKRHQRLKVNFLRSLYARMTNNDFFFNAINWDYIRALKTMVQPELSKAAERVVSDLRANGIAFAHFTEFFAADFFEVIQDRFQVYLKEFNQNNADSVAKGKAVFLDTIHKAHTFVPNDPVSTYLSEEMFARIAASYMNMVPRFVGSSFWHTKETIGENRVYSQEWHRDYNDRALTKIFLYVSDVGPEEGYFEYLTGSHRKGPLGQCFDRIGADGYRAYPDPKKIDELIKKLPVMRLDAVNKDSMTGKKAPWHDQPTVIQCLAPKGTLIFADTFGLHRGGYVQKGFRDMIMLTYSTNFNIHKPHFTVTKAFANSIDPFMQMSFGVV